MKENIDFDAIVDQIFTLHNKLRTNPKSFIPYLNSIAPYYQGIFYKPPFLDHTLKTHQGLPALQQAIQALENATPVQPLEWSYTLHLAADQHSIDNGQSGLYTHTSSKGLSLQERVQKYGSWSAHLAQSLQIGSKQPKQIIANLLIDDGLITRGHRRNIFSKQLKYIGIGFNTHSLYGYITVLTYAKDVEQINPPEGNKSQQKQIFQSPKPIQPQSAYRQQSSQVQSKKSKRQQAIKQLQNSKQQQESNCIIV